MAISWQVVEGGFIGTNNGADDALIMYTVKYRGNEWSAPWHLLQFDRKTQVQSSYHADMKGVRAFAAVCDPLQEKKDA